METWRLAGLGTDLAGLPGNTTNTRNTIRSNHMPIGIELGSRSIGGGALAVCIQSLSICLFDMTLEVTTQLTLTLILTLNGCYPSYYINTLILQSYLPPPAKTRSAC